MRVHVAEQRPQRRLVQRSDPFGVEGGVGLADVVEDQAQPERQVEVVVQGVAVGHAHLGRALRQRGVLLPRRRRPVDPVGELAQPSHLLRRGVQRLRAEADARSVVR